MRTLDEMIKEFELEELSAKGRYEGGGWYLIGGDELADAIQYLREYREMKEHLACLDAAALHGEDTQRVNNPALTWDELRQMEGKPVWVEYNLHLSDEDARSRMWIIIQHIFPWKKDDELIYYNGLVLGKKEMGKTWNAYRKER